MKALDQGARRAGRRAPAARTARSRRFAALLACALAVPLTLLLSAQSADPYASVSSTDWRAGILRVEVSIDLVLAGIRLPAGRAQAERALEARVPEAARPVVLAVGLDSYRTIGDALEDGSVSPADLDGYLEHGQKKETRLSPDMRRLVAVYEFSLTGLGSLFVRHSAPREHAPLGSYAPTRPYSGILIYVQGEFPVRGEHKGDALAPCLLPRIYDDTMEVLLERNLMEPAALAAWGAVGWATRLDDPAIEKRVGDDPLKLMASAIFGTRRSDVILSRADALKILASPHNRELIRKGKVVLVYGPAP